MWDKGENATRQSSCSDSAAGHCELFATAATLLLRKADIPTRYAVGYNHPGGKPKERRAVVRERHAHAWVHRLLQRANGTILIRRTGSWASVEAERLPGGSRWRDLWSQAWFGFSKWRLWKNQPTSLHSMDHRAPSPLCSWHSFSGGKARPGQKAGKQQAPNKVHPGFDSEFYAIERSLEAQGFWSTKTRNRSRLADANPGSGAARALGYPLKAGLAALPTAFSIPTAWSAMIVVRCARGVRRVG